MRLKLILAILFAFSSAIAASAVESQCSCHELVWKDSEIQIYRVTIAPHSSTSPFWHFDDYAFVPLTNQETLEAVKPGMNRNPYLSASLPKNHASWVSRDSTIRFVHPQKTESAEGQILFNGTSEPYVGLEISAEKSRALPDLQSRISMFGGDTHAALERLLGAYSIRVASVAALGYFQLENAGSGLLFAVNAIKLGTDYASSLDVSLGQAVSLDQSSRYRNLTTIPTRVLIVSRPLPTLAMQSPQSAGSAVLQ